MFIKCLESNIDRFFKVFNILFQHCLKLENEKKKKFYNNKYFGEYSLKKSKSFWGEIARGLKLCFEILELSRIIDRLCWELCSTYSKNDTLITYIYLDACVNEYNNLVQMEIVINKKWTFLGRCRQELWVGRPFISRISFRPSMKVLTQISIILILIINQKFPSINNSFNLTG